MAILGILKFPDPILKTKAAPVAVIDEGIKTLINDMVETMYAARGIGLASVQVGVAKRVIVLDVPDEPLEEGPSEEESPKARQKGKNLVALINPEILESEGSITYEEGCLSVPGITADVHRASRVRIKALDKEDKGLDFWAEGLYAIALQHEIDHIDGILFIDRLSRLKREMIKRRLKKALEEQRAL